MKLLLSFCFFFGVVSATFKQQECGASFVANIGKILSLNQNQLPEICANATLVDQKIGILRGILADCGLDQWNSGSSADIQVGSMIEGLFSFAKQIMCSRASSTNNPNEVEYCFPHAIKLLSLPKLITMDWQSASYDLKCSIMGDDATVRKICPTAPKDSAKHKCKTEMVKVFDQALGTVERMLAAHPPNKVKTAIKPLLDLAVDVRMMCKTKTRKAVRAFFKSKCAGDTPVPSTDDKLALDVCNFHSTHPGKNRIKKFIRAMIALKEQYFLDSGIEVTMTYLDGRILNVTFIKSLCCPANCMAQRGLYLNKFESRKEIRKEGINLWADFQSRSDEGKTEMEDALCKDEGSAGEFDWNDCEALFEEGTTTTTARRLLGTTTSIIATINVNSTDTVSPITCENGGSLYGFDSQFNSTSQADQTSCNCTQTCSDPDLGFPTLSSSTTTEVGSNISTGSNSTTPKSGAMKLTSLSFGFLFCSFFTFFKL